MLKKISIFISLILIYPSCFSRSIHRTPEPNIPTIEVFWENDGKKYTLKNVHLDAYPFFKIFDEPYFQEHLLPDQAIHFRNNTEKKVLGSHLANLIEKLVNEISQKKKQYSDFIILQKKGFNRRNSCGLLVVKFKDYPFVVKLFMETPKSFINPWAKGFEPIFFFYMGNGVNRHLSGFTRIKNLEYITTQITNNAEWKSIIDTPRKWFWKPKNNRWLCLHGINMGYEKKEYRSKIPGTYAIIADAIESDRSFSSFNKQDLDIALRLSNSLDCNLDLHISNFMVEKNTNKIVIIDTEHFPTMIGLKEKIVFNSYISWLSELVGKCGRDMIFSTKKSRRLAQQKTIQECLVPFSLNDLQNQPVAQRNAQLC